LRLCIRIQTDGAIFEATSGWTIFKLSAVAEQVIEFWY